MRFIGKTPIPETIDEIERLKTEYLVPEQVAPILGTSAETIMNHAKSDPTMLGFGVCVLGTRVKIPRRAFVYWLNYGNAAGNPIE